MGWNIKKIKSKINDFFKTKKIEYSFNEIDNKYRFEICLQDAGIIIYPYVKIFGNDMISFNVNVSENDVIKNNYINDFNLKSKLLKAHITPENMVYLEYRFLMSDYIDETLELLIEQLFIHQKDIDLL